jgi:hypothetical protein
VRRYQTVSAPPAQLAPAVFAAATGACFPTAPETSDRDARQILKLAGTTDAETQRQVNDNMLGPAVLDVGCGMGAPPFA